MTFVPIYFFILLIFISFAGWLVNLYYCIRGDVSDVSITCVYCLHEIFLCEKIFIRRQCYIYCKLNMFHISIYLCPKALNIKSFCLYELLSHTHFLCYSNNHIGNIFFRRKGNGDLLVLLHSYLHLHFVINAKTEEKVLEFVNETNTCQVMHI